MVQQQRKWYKSTVNDTRVNDKSILNGTRVEKMVKEQSK